MNAQNALTVVGHIVSITPSKARLTGQSKIELVIETPTKDEKLPLRFRSIAYGGLAENLGVSVGDWCVASGRLESARFGQGSVGMMLLLRDIFRIESTPPTQIDSGTF